MLFYKFSGISEIIRNMNSVAWKSLGTLGQNVFKCSQLSK